MSRHLGDQLSDYADRRLPARELLAWDRHVVACECCRYAVDAERRMLASLRTVPAGAVSPGLHALLLQVAAASVAGDGPPAIPRAPFPAPDVRLPIVAASTPALHRSARRVAALVGLAAGASAAAAWSLGAGPVSQASMSVAPPARVAAPAPVTLTGLLVSPGAGGAGRESGTRVVPVTFRDPAAP